MNIMIGVGIGEIQFGITQEELILMLGSPDKIVDIDMLDVEIYTKRYIYNDLMTTFCFDVEEEDRLNHMESANPDLCLWNQKLIGMDREDLMKFLRKQEVTNLECEDYNLSETIYCEDIGVEFNLEFDRVESVTLGVLFDKDDNIIWP